MNIETKIWKLKRARTLLENRWVQGSDHYHPGETVIFSILAPRKDIGDKNAHGYCMIGALKVVSSPYDTDFTGEFMSTECFQELRDAVSECIPDSFSTGYGLSDKIVRYNDKKGRSKRYILKVFDCAIKRLENQQ